MDFVIQHYEGIFGQRMQKQRLKKRGFEALSRVKGLL